MSGRELVRPEKSRLMRIAIGKLVSRLHDCLQDRRERRRV
jgi:hypothetical protein